MYIKHHIALDHYLCTLFLSQNTQAMSDTSLIAEYEVVDCNFMSVLKSYHRLGFPLFLIPNQKTDIPSFLKKSFLPFLLTFPVFNEICIAAST
jgi:hypothetical protein